MIFFTLFFRHKKPLWLGLGLVVSALGPLLASQFGTMLTVAVAFTLSFYVCENYEGKRRYLRLVAIIAYVTATLSLPRLLAQNTSHSFFTYYLMGYFSFQPYSIVPIATIVYLVASYAFLLSMKNERFYLKYVYCLVFSYNQAMLVYYGRSSITESRTRERAASKPRPASLSVARSSREMGKSCSTCSTRCRRERRTSIHGMSTRINSRVQGARYAKGTRRSAMAGGKWAIVLNKSLVRPEPIMASAAPIPRPIARSIDRDECGGGDGLAIARQEEPVAQESGDRGIAVRLLGEIGRLREEAFQTPPVRAQAAQQKPGQADQRGRYQKKADSRECVHRFALSIVGGSSLRSTAPYSLKISCRLMTDIQTRPTACRRMVPATAHWPIVVARNSLHLLGIAAPHQRAR